MEYWRGGELARKMRTGKEMEDWQRDGRQAGRRISDAEMEDR